jgi:hypothetical protein
LQAPPWIAESERTRGNSWPLPVISDRCLDRGPSPFFPFAELAFMFDSLRCGDAKLQDLWMLLRTSCGPVTHTHIVQTQTPRRASCTVPMTRSSYRQRTRPCSPMIYD